MLTVDDLISFGYWRKHYHTMVDDKLQARQYSKGEIKAYQRAYPDRSEEIRRELIEQNEQFKQEAHDECRRTIQRVVDSLNERGMTMEQLHEYYKSD